MSRDGLLPRWLSRVHPRFGTPHRITIIVGVVVAVLAGFIPLEELAEHPSQDRAATSPLVQRSYGQSFGPWTPSMCGPVPERICICPRSSRAGDCNACLR
ncbi:hypothetical protein [Micromonospora globispora]|uniref:hypothetical protein n=1 Tax=Micromonospora globispora TaxID=1450148 RepID=UPI001A9C2D89|nr:hypothetical protein [Micromonospora globispora]